MAIRDLTDDERKDLLIKASDALDEAQSGFYPHMISTQKGTELHFSSLTSVNPEEPSQDVVSEMKRRLEVLLQNEYPNHDFNLSYEDFPYRNR